MGDRSRRTRACTGCQDRRRWRRLRGDVVKNIKRRPPAFIYYFFFIRHYFFYLVLFSKKRKPERGKSLLRVFTAAANNENSSRVFERQCRPDRFNLIFPIFRWRSDVQCVRHTKYFGDFFFRGLVFTRKQTSRDYATISYDERYNNCSETINDTFFVRYPFNNFYLDNSQCLSSNRIFPRLLHRRVTSFNARNKYCEKMHWKIQRNAIKPFEKMRISFFLQALFNKKKKNKIYTYTHTIIIMQSRIVTFHMIFLSSTVRVQDKILHQRFCVYNVHVYVKFTEKCRVEK